MDTDDDSPGGLHGPTSHPQIVEKDNSMNLRNIENPTSKDRIRTDLSPLSSNIGSSKEQDPTQAYLDQVINPAITI